MAATETYSLAEFERYASEMGAWDIDFTKPLKSSRVKLRSETLKNFQQERSPDGQPWAPLATSTIFSKAQKGEGAEFFQRRRTTKGRPSKPMNPGKKLQDEGVLRASATGGGPGHVNRLTDRSLEFGSNLEYAATHQYGATIHRGPVRPRRRKCLFWVDGGNNPHWAKSVGPATIKIPARPFLGISPATQEWLAKKFGDFIQDELERRHPRG